MLNRATLPRIAREGFEARLEFRVEGILFREHVADVADSDSLRTVVAQEVCECVYARRRAVQREHAGRGRSAERGGHPETLARLCKQRIVASGKPRPHLPEPAGACLGGETV